MNPTTNPAARLLNILRRARAVPDGGHTIRHMWCAAFGLPETDLPSLYRALLAMQELVDKVEARVRQQPSLNSQVYLENTPTIREVLAASNLDASCQVVQRRLTADLLKDLVFCGEILALTDPEEAVSEEDIQWIQAEVGDLFDGVAASGLPGELRDPLLDLLEAMRRAIAAYRIRGAAALREALATGLGEIMRLYAEAGGDMEVQKEPVVVRTKAFLARLDGIVGKALKYKPLVELVWPYLPNLLGGG